MYGQSKVSRKVHAPKRSSWEVRCTKRPSTPRHAPRKGRPEEAMDQQRQEKEFESGTPLWGKLLRRGPPEEGETPIELRRASSPVVSKSLE